MDKSWKETLTEKEHQDLHQIIEKIEAQNAERAEAIFTLSQLRGIKPEVLMTEIS